MPVGFRTGSSFDPLRLNWDGSGPRPLPWTAWYPTDEKSSAHPLVEKSWFRKQPVGVNAQIAHADGTLPLVLLSHGTGSTAAGLEWLGFRLAEQGFVALAVNHHGHTAFEPFRAEGFLCMWERAKDLTAILDDPNWRNELRVETGDQIFAAGFSAGAYTALLLSGARIAFSQFEPDNPEKSPIRGPREFPNLADQLPKLFENPVFRRSWEQRRSDFSDRRIRAAFAIAPGRSVLGFSQDSLQAINKPVHLIGGDEDTVAPPDQCCKWLFQNIPDCRYEILTGGVGHYTFLPEGSEIGREAAPELFMDGAGLDRTAIHDYAATLAAEFFRST
ncbi:alpha/beta fold hydrolase [Agrobacterium vitis]|uniref:alpha/beta hydrolase family protein n=1 Tax=Agrobacterium vitis TaxID=373 RepID=UPI0012E8C778|nr:alpha/beta fold hydrolase [Agrobacterium vitis]MVA72867.1 alpha/beta fold hydrolase [Agrobacterium vitis]